MNTILGGSFTSRLNMNLREEHGYAYGASSRFDMRLERRRRSTPRPACRPTRPPKRSKEFFNELTRIQKPVPADELDEAKNYVALRCRATSRRRAARPAWRRPASTTLPADYYATLRGAARVRSPRDVKRVADGTSSPTNSRSSSSAIARSSSRASALNLGPITLVEPAEIMK